MTTFYYSPVLHINMLSRTFRKVNPCKLVDPEVIKAQKSKVGSGKQQATRWWGEQSHVKARLPEYCFHLTCSLFAHIKYFYLIIISWKIPLTYCMCLFLYHFHLSPLWLSTSHHCSHFSSLPVAFHPVSHFPLKSTFLFYFPYQSFMWHFIKIFL